MTKITKESLASLKFCMSWKSEQAEHEDCYLARKVNVWRDFFPPSLEQALIQGPSIQSLVPAKSMQVLALFARV